MDWMDVLIHQHNNISLLIDALDDKTVEILNTKTLDKEWLAEALGHISTYADQEHHALEEDTVFAQLREVSEQGRILVDNGMLVEHQLARYYVKEMKKLLNEEVDDTVLVRFIGFAQSYIDLLRRHIDKENNVAYTYAKRMLDQEKLQSDFDAAYDTDSEKEVLAFLNK